MQTVWAQNLYSALVLGVSYPSDAVKPEVV